MNDLTTAGVELAVVVAYGRIIPARLLEQIPMVNLHFSLLPRWRGAAPVERAILAGDRETGVCLMKVEAGLDTGPVYAVRTVPLDDDITLAALRTELVTVASALVVDALAHGVAGLPVPVPQEGEVTMAEKITHGGSPPRLGRHGGRPQAGRTPGPGLDDVPGQAADGARRRAGAARARPRRAPTGFPRRRGRRHGERRPGAAAGAAREPFSHVSRRLAAWGAAGGRRASRDGLNMTAVTVTPIDGWSPDQYERFRSERQQPFDDLLTLCHPVPGGRVVDLGCGTGDLTKILHEEMAAEQTVGIDSSPAMLARAQSAYADVAGLSFKQGDIATWLDEGLDLVFANASLQWIDDHLNLLARMRTALAPDGQLAFQVPANYRHPSHLLAQAVANETPFIDALDGDVPEDRGRFVLSPELYADLLYELGAKDQVVRMEVYGHELESTSEVVEWVMGTLLTPYRTRLSPELFDAFVERYRERLIEELGEREPYFYGFRRILCWARFG